MKTDNSDVTTLLIVDDDPFCVFLTETILQKQFITYSVNNGYAALKVLEEKKIDIVLMDINLDDERMDGLRTMRVIRQNGKYRDVKILAVTAFSDNRKWLIREGFDDLYMKPIVEEEILFVIKNLLTTPTKRFLFERALIF